MRPFGAWFGRLAMAGACLAGAGCGGGGDVPDPDSDSSAARAEPSRVVNRSAAEAPAAEPTALASNTAPAEPEKSTPTPAPAKPDVAEKPAEAEKAAPPVKGDSSGTDEMLRSAGPPGSTPGATTPAPSTPAPSTPAPGPGAGPGTMPPGPAPNQATPTPSPSPGAPGPATPNTVPPPSNPGGAAPGPGGNPMYESSPPPGGPGRAPGGPGGPGFGGIGGMPSPGGPGGTGSPGQEPAALRGNAAFRHPTTAVMAFLLALKAKDKDRLSQTTAARAPTEAEEKHRKIFAAIIEQSISDDELDEMAKAMEGFQVTHVLPAKSTGRIGVVIAKRDGKDMLQRTIMTRKEKEGWKVMDIAQMYDFKPGLPPIFMRGRGGVRRR